MVGDKNNGIPCPEPAELSALHEGMLPRARTAGLNRHLLVCEKCRGAYEKAALEYESAGRVISAAEIFDRLDSHRELARAELSINPPEPVAMEETALDGILQDLGNSESDRFLVTHGKLESLMEELGEKIAALGKNPPITPEGEKNYVSFLAKCVEGNSLQVAGGGAAEAGQVLALMERLKELAAGPPGGAASLSMFRDAADAFREKADNVISKYSGEKP